jgi:hypothetical protein
LDKQRLDERIDSQMQRFFHQIKEINSQFKVMNQTMRRPMFEGPKLPQSDQELLRISKSLLKKVDPSNLKRNTEVSGPVMVSKEDAAVEMIRKMKKEKALKIARQYRAYKLRVCVKKRMAARKILRYYLQVKMRRAACKI